VLEGRYTYLILMLISLAYPLAQSFEHRIRLVKKWKYIFPAIFFMNLLFIPWDIYFTHKGYWGFNEDYTTGVYLVNLPIEEWLFFIIVPYCCFFIYFVLDYFIPLGETKKWARPTSIILGLVLIFLGVNFYSKAYSVMAFGGAGVALLVVNLVRTPSWMGKFLLSYVVCLIPFLLVNGVLTAKPVVWYNDIQNVGIRISLGSIARIPIEDSAYCLLMLIMSTYMYERLASKSVSR